MRMSLSVMYVRVHQYVSRSYFHLDGDRAHRTLTGVLQTRRCSRSCNCPTSSRCSKSSLRLKLQLLMLIHEVRGRARNKQQRCKHDINGVFVDHAEFSPFLIPLISVENVCILLLIRSQIPESASSATAQPEPCSSPRNTVDLVIIDLFSASPQSTDLLRRVKSVFWGIVSPNGVSSATHASMQSQVKSTG